MTLKQVLLSVVCQLVSYVTSSTGASVFCWQKQLIIHVVKQFTLQMYTIKEALMSPTIVDTCINTYRVDLWWSYCVLFLLILDCEIHDINLFINYEMCWKCVIHKWQKNGTSNERLWKDTTFACWGVWKPLWQSIVTGVNVCICGT